MGEGENPQQVAADQLIKDGVEVLHTVGGDDTNTAAADLSQFLLGYNYHLCVIGMPKTIDNDVFPIKQSLGAWTAAEQGAIFFENVVNEATANPRMMIVHEVMGRDCGYLTAATAQKYRQRLHQRLVLPQLGVTHRRFDIHAVYLPEIPVDIDAEAKRVKDIVAKMEAEGKEIQRDAFGHVKLDTIQPGKYFADVFSGLIGAEKVMVQKSGYFARSAAANHDDILLIRQSAQLAVDSACTRGNGVVGLDEDAGDVLRLCEFNRIKGGKSFNTSQPWFTEMLADIGQV